MERIFSLQGDERIRFARDAMLLKQAQSENGTRKVFTFLHKSIQEYLVALGMKINSSVNNNPVVGMRIISQCSRSSKI